MEGREDGSAYVKSWRCCGDGWVGRHDGGE